MKPWVKRALLGVVGLVAIVVVGGGGYVYSQVAAFDASVDEVRGVPLPELQRSADPAVLARGRHLVESLGACANSDCHGPDLGGGRTLAMGPLGTFSGPNITGAGLGAVYSDGELHRLIRHGIKKDGRGVRFMPSHEFNWLPDDDLTALISYLRTVPEVERANGPVEVGVLGKVLDRRGMIHIDVARRIDHDAIELAPPPTPTAAYGRFVARLCTGCHGEQLSGGPIPGAPSSIPTPTNITPHATGLAGWSYDDFTRLLREGVKKGGERLDPFMPIEAFGKLDDTETRALWAYLESVPPVAFGNR